MYQDQVNIEGEPDDHFSNPVSMVCLSEGPQHNQGETNANQAEEPTLELDEWDQFEVKGQAEVVGRTITLPEIVTGSTGSQKVTFQTCLFMVEKSPHDFEKPNQETKVLESKAIQSAVVIDLASNIKLKVTF